MNVLYCINVFFFTLVQYLHDTNDDLASFCCGVKLLIYLCTFLVPLPRNSVTSGIILRISGIIIITTRTPPN